MIHRVTQTADRNASERAQYCLDLVGDKRGFRNSLEDVAGGHLRYSAGRWHRSSSLRSLVHRVLVPVLDRVCGDGDDRDVVDYAHLDCGLEGESFHLCRRSSRPT